MIEPYFLTFDDRGALRIHYVKEGTEETIVKGERFHSGNFRIKENII